MPQLSEDHVANAIDILESAALSRASALNQYSTEKVQDDSDEEENSSCPIYDSFYFQNGSQTILTMTNFTSKEFESIWREIERIVAKKWNVGRGKKYFSTVKDIFFMTLTVLKNAGKWDMLGAIFQTTGPSLERVVMKFVQTISYEIYVHHVEEQEKKWPMKNIIQKNLTFKTYKYCRYATDVIFQQSFRPSGRLEESKKYFSGKHKMYGFKTEVLVLSNGVALFMSPHVPDLPQMSIYFTRTHKAALEKAANEGGNYVLNSGDLLEEYDNMWGVLMDKGFQGAAEHVRAIIPKKKPRRRMLLRREQERNRKISLDRIIVENFFGRLTQLWAVIGSKYRWGEKFYDDIFMFCLAFTNVHVEHYPLRAEDGQHYNRVRNRLLQIGEEMLQKRRLAQRTYKAKRQRRLTAKHRDIGSDDETQDPRVG